ncbi:MAG: MFS transporter [Ktedonobacteraceae bacterium]
MSIETPAQPAQQSPKPAIDKKHFFINRNFTFLALGQAISNMGDFVYSTTLLVWVFTLSHSATAVSGVLIAQYAPIFLLGPLAGVFVDRWNRRSTMVASDLARMVVALLPLVVPASLRLPAIYTSVFLISALARFFMPAKSGVLQVIVPDKAQGQAASISQATFALAIVIGPAIGPPLYFLVGPFIGCIINAISFLVSALSLLAIRVPGGGLRPVLIARGQDAAGGLRLVLRELAVGFRFVAKTRVLLMVTFLALIAMLGAGCLNALDIIFVSQRLHASTVLYGPLMAVGGVGALLGAIAAGLLVRRVEPRYLLSGSLLLLGLGIIFYAFQTTFLAALVINFIISIPNGGIEVGFAPILLNTTPRALMGRVESVIQTAMYATSLLSVALAGYFGQFVPVYIIFAVGGALLALSGIFGWFSVPAQPEMALLEP